MLNNYSIALGSILIGNTISNIVCSSLVTLLVEKYYGNAYVALATGILTLFVLIFCEY
ncbi:MAG: CNNM domain-containing protein [Mycoplasmoidaceae bacterium]|nr:CNNM domain-containing protein [Mycoplasmoidaceae bacterium]